MRRNLCLLVLTALLSLWMTNASAQLRLGVKGGYNYTNWSFGKLKVNKPSRGKGSMTSTYIRKDKKVLEEPVCGSLSGIRNK